MTLTVDSKGRICCRDLFEPHTSLSAERDDRGRVILVRLAKQERPPKLVKPVPYKGGYILPDCDLDLDKLVKEIHEERERRDEELLG